jgi:hypothetical protein
MDIIKANGATAKGVIVAVDRQEKGKGEQSAIQEVEQNFNIHPDSKVSSTPGELFPIRRLAPHLVSYSRFEG